MHHSCTKLKRQKGKMQYRSCLSITFSGTKQKNQYLPPKN
uniref:Uncharacterized protein n=1 Tax=Rhizophora mucronata TaxID=61149 RepID=A0A2P2P394_RHIMU